MLWDMRASTRDPLQTLKDATSSITSLSIPPDSVQIIAGSMDGHVRAYDIRMGQMTEDLVGCKCLQLSFACSELINSPRDSRGPVTVVAEGHDARRLAGREAASFRPVKWKRELTGLQ